VSCVTPGLGLRTRDVRGRASRPQGIEPERARRLTGGSLRFLATRDVTQPPGEHGRPRCNGCLGPTRRVAELAARPVAFQPYRRGTPEGCSRDFEEILGSPLQRYSSWRRTVDERSSTSLRYTNGSRPAILSGLDRASAGYTVCRARRYLISPLQEPQLAPEDRIDPACGTETDTGNGRCGRRHGLRT
jgi:hypothetical protein